MFTGIARGLTAKLRDSHVAESTSGVVTLRGLSMLRGSCSPRGNGMGEAEAEYVSFPGES